MFSIFPSVLNVHDTHNDTDMHLGGKNFDIRLSICFIRQFKFSDFHLPCLFVWPRTVKCGFRTKFLSDFVSFVVGRK
jgi:hypothetical protein